MPETTHNSELFNLLMDIRKNEAQMGKLVKKLEGDIPNRERMSRISIKGTLSLF